MVTNALRSLWAEPRAADAPERVSRDRVLVGALMVTALALLLDAALAFAVWLSVPGTGRLTVRGRRMPQPFLGDEVVLESPPRATSQRARKTTDDGRYERGDPSHTV